MITSDLKLLKNEEIIDKATYKNFKPVGSRLGVLYGLQKVHKETKNRLPFFRSILSVLYTYLQTSKVFITIFITPLTENEYTVKDSFHFGKQICKQDPDLCMTSLYVDSLYTHIPPNKTVDICIDSL